MKEEKIRLKHTRIATTISAVSEISLASDAKCPQCGKPLEMKSFVDAWNTDTNEPTDVNNDPYCQKCDLRWAAEKGPHRFKEE